MWLWALLHALQEEDPEKYLQRIEKGFDDVAKAKSIPQKDRTLQVEWIIEVLPDHESTEHLVLKLGNDLDASSNETEHGPILRLEGENIDFNEVWEINRVSIKGQPLCCCVINDMAYEVLFYMFW